MPCKSPPATSAESGDGERATFKAFEEPPDAAEKKTDSSLGPLEGNLALLIP